MDKRVLALDPGTTETAYVLWDGSRLFAKGIVSNKEILSGIYDSLWSAHICYIEEIAGYGMSVGAEVFKTIYWYGRFAEAWYTNSFDAVEAILVPRKAIKLHHCGSGKATDANIRQALIDRFGAPGKKSNPNPITFGVTKHEWSALAIAAYAIDVEANRA